MALHGVLAGTFDSTIDGPLDNPIKGVPVGTTEGTPRDALSDLQKDAQGGEFEFPMRFCLWLHLLVQSSMHKCAQNNSSSGGTVGALEGAFNGGLDIAISRQSSL